ncbi:response regulator [Paenibacillus hexagrammi]|uniref:Response regulator n=1 Tax=Paenibacillus hexagrammi TaxID=2908839 RepID=A0ABY3SF35_9BACL|nr:response regulator [Paenibacillus sp. YPD9-1]UJF32516.1 response regulator [Paenibacillus sp. YPD9-1]
MYKLIIADDESIFRVGLGKMVREVSDQWDIVGEARNGYEALELVSEHSPDLVITDIRMPQMDGIGLQYVLKEKYPNVMVIVLSGYDEFSFARDSLRLGARDYLTKPVTREDLSKALLQAAEEIRIAQQSKETESREDLQVKQLMRQHFLEAMVAGRLHEEEHPMLQKLGIACKDEDLICMIVSLDRESIEDERYFQKDPALFLLYIKQFLQEMLDQSGEGLAFVDGTSQVTAVVHASTFAKTPDFLQQFGSLFRKQIKGMSHLTVTVGIGGIARSLDEVPRSYKEAEMALLYRLVQGGDRVIEYNEVAASSSEKELLPLEWKSIEMGLYEGKEQHTREEVNRFVTELCSQANSPAFIIQECCKMLLHFYELAVGLPHLEEWAKENDIKHILAELSEITDRKELAIFCADWVGNLAASMGSRKKQTHHDPVQIVVDYITECYAEPLSLAAVAEKVFLNPSYLSTLFKQKKGKPFIDYVTEVRIDAAKKLLLTTEDKLQAISEKTGFVNMRHFHRVFKDHTGVTPNQYRSMMHKE